MDPCAASVLTPEEEELQIKTDELSRLEQELAEKELLLSTTKGELHLFEKRYNQIVGAKYAELDELRAQILGLVSRLEPRKGNLKAQADAAREQADRSARESREARQHVPVETDENKFAPSDELKKIFRDAAKKIHPDLASDAEQRDIRHQLMAQLNKAYDEMDARKIKSILHEWEEGLHAGEDLTVGMKLVKKIRQISQAREGLNRIRSEIDQLENSEMYKLKERIERTHNTGRDVLNEMVASLDEKIIRVKARILQLADDLAYI